MTKEVNVAVQVALVEGENGTLSDQLAGATKEASQRAQDNKALAEEVAALKAKLNDVNDKKLVGTSFPKWIYYFFILIILVFRFQF